MCTDSAHHGPVVGLRLHRGGGHERPAQPRRVRQGSLPRTYRVSQAPTYALGSSLVTICRASLTRPRGSCRRRTCTPALWGRRPSSSTRACGTFSSATSSAISFLWPGRKVSEAKDAPVPCLLTLARKQAWPSPRGVSWPLARSAPTKRRRGGGRQARRVSLPLCCSAHAAEQSG